MKITLLLFITAPLVVFSNVYRVNNNPGVDADFTTFAAAHAAAAPGDTLYIEGSFNSYGAATVSKPIVILGAGYFLTSNDSTQALPYSSNFTTMTIAAGAAGSYISGLNLTSAPSGPVVTISASNVSFVRNRVVNTATGTSTAIRGITISNSINNVLIAQNFLQIPVNNTTARSVLFIGTNSSGIIVSNNIILRGTSLTTDYNRAIEMPTSSQAIFTNNVVLGNWVSYNSILENNIHVRGIYTTSANNPNTTRNNLSYNTQFGNSNGNLQNITMNTVFTYSGPFAEDNYWSLRAGSPAIGSGSGGIDCGVYDGAFPLKKSGLPAIPAIFNAIVPLSATTSNGLEIEIQSKTHN